MTTASKQARPFALDHKKLISSIKSQGHSHSHAKKKRLGYSQHGERKKKKKHSLNYLILTMPVLRLDHALFSSKAGILPRCKSNPELEAWA